ncbi:MAG TPA: chemotaxis response regulator protein-glutamate methylesterase [Bryobacteraceae bacterium]|jgi:two-component system chemotaxis response regulator CheB
MILRKIKVLVVDDSALVRRVLGDAVGKEPDMELVGVAPDPFVARDMILTLRPDVVTLDIEMPRMDGLTFLTKLMRFHPLPVIVISSVGQATCDVAMEALRRGAVEVMAKPSGPNSVGEVSRLLPGKIRAAFGARVRSVQAPLVPVPTVQAASRAGLIAIGASTGGTQAIEEVLLQMPGDCPPTVITQHIPPVFSAAFASRLNSVCKMEVKEARDGDVVSAGRVLIAPGDFHMLFHKVDGVSRVVIRTGPRVHYQRPAVDVLFRSIAAAKPANAVGVLLTGMGSDGAEGLLEMRKAGAWTIAQDEASCVVFGMPKVAIDLGAAQQILPLPKIAAGALGAFTRAKVS